MAMSVADREYAEAWVDRVQKVRADGEKVSSTEVAAAAAHLGRKPRTIWRWIREGVPQDRVDGGRKLSDDESDAYYIAGGNCARANRLLVAAGVEPVPIRQYQRMIQTELTPRQIALARGGSAMASRYTLYLERIEKGRNACWEADHKQANVLVKRPRGRGDSNLVRPWITVFLDTWSRVVVGICISVRPTQAEVLSALGAAMDKNPDLSPGFGIPDLLRVDNGTEFTANSITETAGSLDIAVVHTPPYTPHRKGKIERWNRTSKEELWADMPYYTNGRKHKDGSLQQSKGVEALPFEVMVSRTLEWVRYYNFERSHHGIGGLTPAEKWAEGERAIRPISPVDLRRFTRKALPNGRVVTQRGIRAFNRFYTSLDLFDLVDEARVKPGEKVEVRYRPHDERSLDVYHRGRFLTTAEPHDQITGKRREKFYEAKADRARILAQAAAKASRQARVRTAGVVAAGVPEEIDVLDTSEVADVSSPRDQELLEGLGVAEERGKPHRSAATRKRSNE